MRVILRVALSAALILTDATQSFAAMTATQDDNAAVAYERRMKKVVDGSDATWKRLSSSICTGCGSAPSPLVIDPPSLTAAVPSSVTKPSVATANEPVTAQAAIPLPSRTSEQRRPRARYAGVRRQTRSYTRLGWRGRRHARYAFLPRLHRTVAQAHAAHSTTRHARRASRITWKHSRTQVAAVANARPVTRKSDWVSPRDRGYPLPKRSRQRYAICTYDRGFLAALGLERSVCVAAL